MPKKSNETFLWLLFSAGGVMTALFIPIHVFLFGLAFPLGWIDPPGYESLSALLRLPLTRAYLFVLCFLALFIGHTDSASLSMTACKSNTSTH